MVADGIAATNGAAVALATVDEDETAADLSVEAVDEDEVTTFEVDLLAPLYIRRMRSRSSITVRFRFSIHISLHNFTRNHNLTLTSLSVNWSNVIEIIALLTNQP